MWKNEFQHFWIRSLNIISCVFFKENVFRLVIGSRLPYVDTFVCLNITFLSKCRQIMLFFKLLYRMFIRFTHASVLREIGFYSTSSIYLFRSWNLKAVVKPALIKQQLLYLAVSWLLKGVYLSSRRIVSIPDPHVSLRAPVIELHASGAHFHPAGKFQN